MAEQLRLAVKVSGNMVQSRRSSDVATKDVADISPASVEAGEFDTPFEDNSFSFASRYFKQK
jgi:hypothetical protein